MAKRVGGSTPEEVNARIANDPVKQAAIAAHEAVQAKWVEIWRVAERPLVEELRAAGYAVDSIWDLYKFKPYPSAIPILIDHLSKDYPDRIREGIARRLAVPTARKWWPTIRDYYEKAATPDAKMGLAVAVAATFSKQYLDEYIDVIKNPKNGTTRVLLVRTLNRQKVPSAQAALNELENDPQLARQISKVRRGISANS